MWVYAYKYGPVGEIRNEKAGVVVLGNLQGALDHSDTYSAVAKATSIRIVLVYAVSLIGTLRMAVHASGTVDKTVGLNCDLK